MENNLYTFSLSLEHAQLVVQSLRNEAFQLTQESHRACEKGSRDYGAVLWEETTVLNNLADFIDIELPV